MPSRVPFFSIIIPVYNLVDYIQETLSGIKDQLWDDYEIIIVDDGSTDGTAELLDRLDNPRLTVLHQRNKGVSCARNIAINAAKGTYIAFLDGDDIWLPEHLSHAAHFFQAHPNAAWYTSNYAKSFSPEQDKKNIHPGEQPVLRLCHYFTDHNFRIHSSSTIIRRDAIPEGGMFPEDLRYGEDLVAFASIASLHPIIGVNDSITVLYRQRRDSAVYTPIDLNTKVEQDAAIFRHFMAIPTNREDARAAMNYYQSMSQGFWIDRIMCSRLNAWLPYIRERKAMTGTLTSLWIALFVSFNCLNVIIFSLPLLLLQKLRVRLQK